MKILPFVLGAFLLFPACCDDDNYVCSDQGIILGEDPRDCVCCGGWFIEIGDDTLRAQTLPEAFLQTLYPVEYPLPVRLDWEPDTTPCLGDEIEVSCMEKI